MNPVIHLLLWLIIGPEHGLVHIYADMTLDLSYFGIKIPLSNCSCRKWIGISMCLTLGVTLLYSTTEIKLVFYSQFNVGASVWSYRASMYLQNTLFLFTALYMYLIYPSVDSEAIAG